MTDRQIRCFLALYETLNFSAAARQLFLTQPTLSYQIRTLEEELGTPLFTRTTCRVEPTEAGQLFAAFAQNVRQSYQAFQHALAAGPARREKLVLQVPLTMASRDLVYHDLLLALSQELCRTVTLRCAPIPPVPPRKRFCRAAWTPWYRCCWNR